MDLLETKHTFVCMPGKAVLQPLTKKFREWLKNKHATSLPKQKTVLHRTFALVRLLRITTEKWKEPYVKT